MDREKVIEWLKEISLRPCDFTTEDFDATQTEHLADDALAMLKEQPEIVLCKDCKHWGTSDCAMYNPFGNDEPTWDDWFCPIGERR